MELHNKDKTIIILGLLTTPRSITQLVKLLEISKNSVFYYVKKYYLSGHLQKEKKGKFVFYVLTEKGLDFLAGLKAGSITTGFSKEHRKGISRSMKKNWKDHPEMWAFIHTPEYKEKMRKALSGDKNPRYGIHLSSETKRKISEAEKGKKVIMTDKIKETISKALKGKYVGENNWNWKGGIRNPRLTNPLLYEIRNCKKYKEWREAVLKKHLPSYPRIPKNTQVHHMKKVTDIIKDNNIKTLEDALACEELWNIDNGVPLSKGDHFLISRLERRKHISAGFIRLLKIWIKENEDHVQLP